QRYRRLSCPRARSHRAGERAGRARSIARYRRSSVRGLPQPPAVHRPDGEIPRGAAWTPAPLCVPADLANQGRDAASVRRGLPGRCLGVDLVLLAESASGQRRRPQASVWRMCRVHAAPDEHPCRRPERVAGALCVGASEHARVRGRCRAVLPRERKNHRRLARIRNRGRAASRPSFGTGRQAGSRRRTRRCRFSYRWSPRAGTGRRAQPARSAVKTAPRRMGGLHAVFRTRLIRGRLGHARTSMSALEQLSPAEAGERLRLARETANVTQAAAASAIGVARTTIVAIEQGERRVKIDEVQKLAKLFGTSVNALLRREAIHVDLAPRFRKLDGDHDDAADEAAELLASLARAEVELENLIGVQRVRNYPPDRPLVKG